MNPQGCGIRDLKNPYRSGAFTRRNPTNETKPTTLFGVVCFAVYPTESNRSGICGHITGTIPKTTRSFFYMIFQSPTANSTAVFCIQKTKRELKMKKHLITLSIALIPICANAATYNLNSSYKIQADADYSYFYYGSTAYNCGGYANTNRSDIIVEHGETVKISGDDNLYYCCDNGLGSDGYWVAFYNADTVPSYTCTTKYTWTALGNNCYCSTTQNVTFDWCRNTQASGIMDSDDIAGLGCEYTDGTKCTTCTHCAGDNYKDSTGCHACPYGGKIAKSAIETYHRYGKTNCYIPMGSDATDDTGTFHIYNGNCYWTE